MRASGLGRFFFAIVATCSITLTCSHGSYAQEAKRPNVLLICVDDLRPELGCYGVEHIKSPNIDRLAAEGRRFDRHYVQVAACGPSRCSMLTGRRELRSWDVWRQTRKLKTAPAQPVSLPHLFKQNGYQTVCIGKISHQPGGVVDAKQTIHEVPFSWDCAFAPVGPWNDPWGAFFCYADGSVRLYGYGRNRSDTPAFEMADVSDDGYADGLNAAAAVEQLGELQRAGKPFMLAVGFYKPHLPHNAPKKYWDMYDRAKIGLPSNYYPPKNTDPKISLHRSYELTTHYKWPGGEGNVTTEQAIRQRHAYFACVSYVDAQVGKVLDEYRRLGLAEDTIVVFWSDHGWHLGEQRIFCKATNYEIATRSPLIIRTPGMAKKGEAARGLVETVDLYPTLADLCQLPKPDGLAGVSLRPLLADPKHPGKTGALSNYSLNGHRGSALRTDRWRLVEWVHAKTGKQTQVELYDHQADSGETVNVASDHPQVVARLLKQLRTQKTSLSTN